jgi:cold shock CspA family protein
MKQYVGLIKAKVRWFDNIAGEGYIRLPDGKSVFVHRSAFGPLYKQEIELNQNETVYVTIHEDYNWMQVSTLVAKKEVI